LGYNKPISIGLVDGSDGDSCIVDLYFQVDGEIDEDNTPVCMVTKEFLTELGF
jgi:hypothetical protein